jgi:hypothetical protein
MKRWIPLLVLALLGCAREPKSGVDLTTAEHDGVPLTLTLSVNRPHRLTLDDRTINFGVAEIIDSRCPKGVTCVQAGEARVALWLEIRREGRDKPEIDRVEMLVPLAEPTFFPAAGLYWRLLSVEPHPAKGNFITTDEYRAKVHVTDEPPPPPAEDEEP